MYCMTLLFAILCILALLGLVCRHTSEVSPVSAAHTPIRAGDYARIRAAANRFGARVPRRTLNAAIYIARLAHDIASEPRAALLATVGTRCTTLEALDLMQGACNAREDLPAALDRFAALPSSPILDEIVTEIAERY